MRKHLFAFLLPPMLFAGCDAFSDSSHMAQMEQLKDSLFKSPGTVSVMMKVQNNLLIVTLGNRQLYKKNEADRREKALALSNMTLRIFGKSSGITTEKMIVTQDERNSVAEPADGLATTINIDSLQKATQP